MRSLKIAIVVLSLLSLAACNQLLGQDYTAVNITVYNGGTTDLVAKVDATADSDSSDCKDNEVSQQSTIAPTNSLNIKRTLRCVQGGFTGNVDLNKDVGTLDFVFVSLPDGNTGAKFTNGLTLTLSNGDGTGTTPITVVAAKTATGGIHAWPAPSTDAANTAFIVKQPNSNVQLVIAIAKNSFDAEPVLGIPTTANITNVGRLSNGAYITTVNRLGGSTLTYSLDTVAVACSETGCL